MTKEKALQRVATLAKKVERGELSLDTWKWSRAEAMAAASDAGASQREIGEAAGMKQSSAGHHIRVWRESGPLSKRPPYTEAYDAIRPGFRDEAQARTDRARVSKVLAAEPELVAEAVASSHEVAEAVAAHPVATARIGVASSRRREEAGRKVRAREFREEEGSQGLATIHVSAEASALRRAARRLAETYQGALAKNPGDDELKTVLDDMLVRVKADVILVIDGLLGDSVEEALTRILESEEASP